MRRKRSAVLRHAGCRRNRLALLVRFHVVDRLTQVVWGLLRNRGLRGRRRRLVPVNDGVRPHGRRWRQSHSGVAHDRRAVCWLSLVGTILRLRGHDLMLVRPLRLVKMLRRRRLLLRRLRLLRLRLRLLLLLLLGWRLLLTRRSLLRRCTWGEE